LICGGSYVRLAGLEANFVTALLGAYLLYAIGSMFELRFDTTRRAAIAIVVDAANFALWTWLLPTGWQSAIACGYLLASTVLLHDLTRSVITAGAAIFIAVVLPPTMGAALIGTVIALAGVTVAIGIYRDMVDQRMSTTMRQNMVIRSQAQGAREAERQRIAADFHDGPLQSFISFQMRLEIIRKWMDRDVDSARDELLQLQDICRNQVTDLRSFVRSMRPADEGMSLAASLSRMADLFQRDTGIVTTFSAGELNDPGETEVSLELLQILREALNNIQKHSGATRVAFQASRNDRGINVIVEDNGSGFPFRGLFTLEELELLRMGPASIKRRVRMLNGEMALDSRPGEGVKMTLRVPV
jgi:signal transduction histidine kinase